MLCVAESANTPAEVAVFALFHGSSNVAYTVPSEFIPRRRFTPNGSAMRAIIRGVPVAGVLNVATRVTPFVNTPSMGNRSRRGTVPRRYFPLPASTGVNFGAPAPSVPGPVESPNAISPPVPRWVTASVDPEPRRSPTDVESLPSLRGKCHTASNVLYVSSMTDPSARARPSRASMSYAVTVDVDSSLPPAGHATGHSSMYPSNRYTMGAAVVVNVRTEEPSSSWTASTHTWLPAVAAVFGHTCRLEVPAVATNVNDMRWMDPVTVDGDPAPTPPPTASFTAGEPPGTHT